MDYYFIVNPNSGNGSGLVVWNQVKQYLREKNIPYDVFFTAKKGDARDKAYEVSVSAAGDLSVFVVGGDGSINEVINGLDMKPNVYFGCIPSGSGNDYCRSMGFNRSPFEIAKKLLTDPCIRDMDYGVINTKDGQIRRRFLVSCGVGFDAAVCHSLEVSKLKQICNDIHMGKLSYSILGFFEYLKEKPIHGSVTLDGDRKVEFKSIFFLSIHNHPYEGGGYKFAPNAQWNDGCLDVTAVSTRSKVKLMPVLLDKKGGLRENGFIRFFPCGECDICLDRPLPMHADGEVLGMQTEFTVRCVHGQLKVLT